MRRLFGTSPRGRHVAVRHTGPRRGSRAVGAAASLAILATLTQVAASDASWRTSEWNNASIGTLDCDASGNYLTRANGRLLSGGLLPLNLDSVATVKGMTVTNDAATTHPDPPSATNPGGGDAYTNPLDLSVLSAIDLPLTSTPLSDFLSIPLNSNVGVVNQYARASSDGTSTGAAGVVNDSGVVDTANDPGTGEPPELGTLKLSSLVSSLTGTAVSDVVAGLTDLSLEVGAVAGRASIDSCAADWSNDLDANLDRDYAIAGLDAVIESPTVSQVVTTTNSAVGSIQTLLNGLAADAGVTSQLTAALTAIVQPLLGTLGLGTTSITGPTVTADFAAVNSLLVDDVSDANGVVQIDLDGGTIRVNLAALLGEAYGGTGFNGTQALGLNGLAPNTELLLNAPVVNALAAAVTSALDDWKADVIAAVEQALYAATVDLTLGLNLTLLGSGNVATVAVTIDDVQLGSLLARPGSPPAVIGIQVQSLLGTCNPVFPLSPACIVQGLLTPITTAVTAGIGPAVGEVLRKAIFDAPSPVATLGATLSAATAPVVTLLSQVLNTYLGVNGLVSLRANIQNDSAAGNVPDPVTGPYADWESGILAVPDGRYDVAALGVGVLNVGGPGANVNLELARGSVGINCPISAPSPCAGY